MSGLIHFTSGKTLELTEREFRNIAPQLNMKGIKTKSLVSGHLVTMNSHTMEFIEYIPEPEEEEVEPVASMTQEEEDKNDEEWAMTQPHKKEYQECTEKPKKKTEDELLADMTAKSNCKHEPSKMELYVQHTAKGVRYFPVCSFCGKRERYVSESKVLKGEYEGTPNEKWTEESLRAAATWVEK